MELFLQATLFLLGASWGSFLHVVAVRTQNNTSFVGGRSHCVSCGKQLQWFELIPVISWLALKRRCRICRTDISASYVITEVCTGVLFLIGWYLSASFLEGLLHLVVVSFFVILFLLDFRAYIVPDRISLPAIVAVFGVRMALGASIETMVLGGIVGGAWFFAQHVLSRGKWVGDGDIRLGALMGVLVGHPFIWVALFVAYVGGSIVAVSLMLFGKKKLSSKLPFGTLLLPAVYVVWLWGDVLWQWYSSFIGL